ncbi:Casein kinase I [Chondrus crispus]|uniref:non-specific serine/threonine protein kinase n=1 Tax=Chondrus crispus TaxID=2769 RepID=R7QHN7_CHOCR|nr:Casein kinase I [Chondrus crispus]CDF37288.1 Casein kinase I [Chondrus crispus]|eukprot:XP_005717107.1 Casein kinase I [Chondrus crispus]
MEELRVYTVVLRVTFKMFPPFALFPRIHLANVLFSTEEKGREPEAKRIPKVTLRKSTAQKSDEGCMPFMHLWRGFKALFKGKGRDRQKRLLYAHLIPGTIIGERFIIRELLGHGGGGKVYGAVDLDTGKQLAVKMVVGKEMFSTLKTEYMVHRALRKAKNITEGLTKIHYLGSYGDMYVMVMDRHGPSLEHLVKASGALKAPDVLRIGLQAIDRLENLHDRGYVHKDIKPENMMMDLDTEQKLHLIDFGLTAKYKDKNGEHVPNVTSKFVGTVCFTSYHVDNSCVSVRRDDMESLMMVLAYMRRGCLPWSMMGTGGEYQGNVRQLLQDIWAAKESVTLEHLCKGMPQEFLEVMRYARGMEFEERPNYEWMRMKFRDALSKLKEERELAQREEDLLRKMEVWEKQKRVSGIKTW